MKRLLIIITSVYVFFLAELFLFGVFGRWGKPELLILLVIFFNLYLGIRYGLICAFFCGLLRDSFGPDAFGMYIFLFMLSAFFATILRRNFYQPGSRLSRLMVTFGVVIVFVVVEAVLKSMVHEVGVMDVARNILAPELLTTMFAATAVFIQLRKIADYIKL